MKKVIVLIKGGIGNQLFGYAAARRLAYSNNADLVIDHVSYFKNDKKYNREFQLDNFQITARKARVLERFDPFNGRVKKIMNPIINKTLFKLRKYIIQEGREFNKNLIQYKVEGSVYINGYWQDEMYFKDIEGVIKDDLKIYSPNDDKNIKIMNEIKKNNSVALHVRWFQRLRENIKKRNLMVDYYTNALSYIESRINNPHYYIFSDDPESAVNLIKFDKRKVTIVNHNQTSANAYVDLWLMSNCNHIITADSTFSWWAAWLGQNSKRIIITPSPKKFIGESWGSETKIPESWVWL